jgi:hypothetical protein
MQRNHAIVVMLALFAAASCSQASADVIQVDGTIRYYTIEGGFWAVRGDDSTTYDPVGGLPTAFQQAGLRVVLQARIRSDLGGFHMVGPIVDIVAIRRL